MRLKIILHFAEYSATTGGIYKSNILMSLTMRPLAPNLESPTAADDGKVHALSGRVIGFDQGDGQTNLNHLDFSSGIASSRSNKRLWLDRWQNHRFCCLLFASGFSHLGIIGEG